MSPESSALPPGFRLRADSRTRRHDAGRVLLGGSPRRALRLSDTGADVAARLLAGKPVCGGADAVLARRLVDTGIAHPLPPATTVALDIVVPVYDDADSLERCLAALAQGEHVVVVDDGSSDAKAIAAVTAAHSARLLRLPANRGPAAARNAGAAVCTADAIAFVDADATVDHATLQELAAHLADPLLAAVAPRVCPQTNATGVLGAFTHAWSPLDLGERAAAVTPHGRVAYVPSTVLVVRRSALLAVDCFDESLRYGEDVDLVWRLDAAGMRVRYEPASMAGHAEPTTWPSWLRRRFAYGTSAGALARRHGERAAPLVMSPAPAATVALLAAGAPTLALAAAASTAWRLRRRLRAADVPSADATRSALVAPAATALAASRWATQMWWPALFVAAAGSRRARPVVAVTLAAPGVVEWVVRRPAIDPVRWTLAFLADDVAYGLGVWRGCVSARTTRPLRPRVSVTRRSRRDTTSTSR